MKHVMLDLETLGTKPGCVVLSIGAVAFDPEHGIGRQFYAVVNTRSCTDRYGLVIDPDTERWWRGRSDDARKVIDEAKSSPIGLADALKQLTEYLTRFNRNNVCVWGNGSDFDNAIVAHCYSVVGQTLGWRYYNSRCFRTLHAMSGRPKRAQDTVKHNALEDATDQAKEALEIMRRLTMREMA